MHSHWLPRRIIVSPGPVEGRADAPPSKSYTHRALLAALLAGGVSLVENPLWSGDTLATLEAVERLGASVESRGRVARLSSPGAAGLSWTPCIDAAESGTTMRLVTAVASLLDRPVLVYGRGRLHRRPVRPLLEALAGLGVRYLASGCCPPHSVQGPARSGSTRVDAWGSSQYLSALLILGAGLPGGLEVSVERLESRPYVDVTVRVLEAFGARVERSGYSWFRVAGGLRATRYRVPGDWSSAAPLLAAGALAGRVGVAGLDPGDPQPDRAVVEVLREAGARVRVSGSLVEAESTGRLEAFTACIRDSPDLAPLLAALAAPACGVSRICCADRLRLKESDRVEAVLDLLHRSRVEARLAEEPGMGLCIEVRGRCGRLPGGVAYSSHGDHRVAMAAALMGLASEKPVVVEPADVVAKSYPGFWEALRGLGVALAEG